MSGPRVSFILPIYNGGRHLRETLESLLAQTFREFEIVAVNDGSTDETAQILRDQHDSRLRVIARENRGLVASLNEAIGAARGELLARIDADDICMPWRLEKQVGFLEAHADVGVVGSAIAPFGGAGAEPLVPPGRPAATMLFRTAIAHPSVMMRKSMLERHRLQYREPYRCAQDYDLWCRCIVRGVGIRNMPGPLIRYRMHAGQITQALAEPTQVEGEAIRAEFVRTMLPEAERRGTDFTQCDRPESACGNGGFRFSRVGVAGEAGKQSGAGEVYRSRVPAAGADREVCVPLPIRANERVAGT